MSSAKAATGPSSVRTYGCTSGTPSRGGSRRTGDDSIPAIASAVLIGDRTGLPDDTRDALQAAGTYHVIAISGGNIAILAAAATLLLAAVAIRGRSAALVAIAMLSGYAFVITAGPSVWRATMMAVLYFAARAVDHRSGGWQSTSVAAALIIVVRPLDVRDAGFILTFGATLALLEGVRMGARLRPRIGALSWVAGSVVASLAIEIALLPVSATLFSRVTGAGARPQSACCSADGYRADRGADSHARGSMSCRRAPCWLDLTRRCTGTG